MKQSRPAWLDAAWPALAAAAAVSVPWLASPPFLDDWHVLQRAHDAPWTWRGLVEAFTFLDRRSIETWNLPVLPAYTFFRPLVVASFKVDMALFGLNPIGLHLSNLLLHLAGTALVAAIALRLGADRRGARIAALLFGLQPQNAVAVVWTAGRTEVLATALVLAGFHAWLVARETRRPLWIAAATAFQALACLAKETAVLLPAVIVAREVAARIADRRNAGPLQETSIAAAPIFLVAGGYAVWRLWFFDETGTLGPPYFLSPATPGFAAFLAAKTVYYLLCLFSTAFVVPVFATDFLLAHPAALAGASLAAAALLALALHGRLRDPLPILGLLWTAAALLPTAPLPAIDLYLYGASPGFALLLAPAFRGDAAPVEALSPRRRRLVGAYLALCVAGFLGRGIFYRQEGVVARRVFEDIRADAPGGLPAGSLLLLVNMPFTAAHTGPMLRLHGEPADLRAMLVTVSSEWATPTWRAQVDCVDDRHVRVRPPPEQGAFFATPEERNLHLAQKPFDASRTYRVPGMTVRPATEGDRVIALDLELDRPLSQGRDRIFVFADDGRRIAHRRCGPDEWRAQP